VTTIRDRAVRDERGASLVLAIAFLVVVAAISAGVLPMITSSIHDRVSLDAVRNREYAADGAVEAAITQTRSRMTAGNALDPCLTSTLALDGTTIRVECSYVPAPTLSGYFQRNVIFTACVRSSSTACGQPATPIVLRAQVNFASSAALDASSITVDRTYVQSWSVNR
jgi:type II secretory pathway pseudopilin PulG